MLLFRRPILNDLWKISRDWWTLDGFHENDLWKISRDWWTLDGFHVCTQTDVCALPPMRQPHTIGTNTTPIFTKDKTTQKGRMLMESGCSPHCRIVSPHLDIQGWDSPVTSPPKTPGWDIPSYFTTTYQEERLRNNLPEAIPYQGPFGEEDPLPPHLAPNPPQWGVVSSSVSPNFQLINFLEDICGNIHHPDCNCFVIMLLLIIILHLD